MVRRRRSAARGIHAEDQTPVTLLSGQAREVRRWLEMVAMVDGFGCVWWVVKMARWSWWRRGEELMTRHHAGLAVAAVGVGEGGARERCVARPDGEWRRASYFDPP